MQNVGRLGKLITHIAVLGIFLSTQFAYGACSMTMLDEGSTIGERLPCHPVAEDSNKTAPDLEADNCCAACIQIALVTSAIIAPTVSVDFIDTLPAASRPSGSFDPPFRPPALNLS